MNILKRIEPGLCTCTHTHSDGNVISKNPTYIHLCFSEGLHDVVKISERESFIRINIVFGRQISLKYAALFFHQFFTPVGRSSMQNSIRNSRV